jgi:2-oxoglutarate ferredoxin oxidoreductase subunit beta
VKAAYHHKGLSFVCIVQRCPEWLPTSLDPWLNDPNRVQLLNHEDGLQTSAGMSRIYKNQLQHDPANIDRAREIASGQETIPVGILYRNPDAPCYEDLRHTDPMRSPESIRAGLNREFDKVTVWPDDESQTQRAA